jgi:hypothetical protein
LQKLKIHSGLGEISSVRRSRPGLCHGGAARK